MTPAPRFRVHRLAQLPSLILAVSSAACGERIELAGVRQDLEKAPIQGTSHLGAVTIDGAEDGDTPTGVGTLPESGDANLGDIDGDGRTDWLVLQSDKQGVVYGGVRPAPGVPFSPALGESILISPPQPDRHGDYTVLRFLGDIDGDGRSDLSRSSRLSSGGSRSDPGPANNSALLWDEQVASLKYGEQERGSGDLLAGVVEFPNPTRDSSAQFLDNLPPEAIAFSVSRGMFMQGLGDVDADGFDDFALTISVHHNGLNEPLGVSGDTTIVEEHDFVSYVLYGSAERITSGAAALESAASFPGVSWMKSVGDVDGDGLSDFIARSETTLRLHLFAGKAGRWQGQVDIASSARIDYDGFGIDARGLGDLDADGCADFLVEISGRVGVLYFLFYGGPELWTRALHTRYADAYFGGGVRGVHSLGDWNGDGFHDVLLDERRRAQVVLGVPERIVGRYEAPQDDIGFIEPDSANLPPPEPVVAAVPTGDIDGDGYGDVGFVFYEAQASPEAYVKYGGRPDVEIH